MKPLSEWDADEVRVVREGAARYQELHLALENYLSANSRMPEAEFQELQGLQNYLANASIRLLGIIDHYIK